MVNVLFSAFFILPSAPHVWFTVNPSDCLWIHLFIEAEQTDLILKHASKSFDFCTASILTLPLASLMKLCSV